MPTNPPTAEHLQKPDGDPGNASLRDDVFLADVLAGLSQTPKRLSSKYLYDERGSALFDQICELPEYYPTRTELAIMESNAVAITREIGPHANVVELGSGSSVKTRLLLDHLDQPRSYIPIDISEDHVLATAQQLRSEYPEIEINPIIDDFCAALENSERFPGDQVCVYFPGSTIGNFPPHDAQRLLHKISDCCGVGGGLLIGFDLQKDIAVLEAAYNDAAGITAEFSLNLLDRMNREAGANFDTGQFRHVAFYNATAERIEIFLESECDQIVRIDEIEISFEKGERIHTEYSHKYTIAGFTQMASHAGLAVRRVWSDDQSYFAIMYLENRNADAN